MASTTWRASISCEMEEAGETWDDVVGTTLSDEDLDREFDNGFGASSGCAFTLWTRDRVYFPVVYDGAEWVGSVARNPCSEASGHHGGE